MVSGNVKILEVCAERMKVSGNANPGHHPDKLFVVGWIDKEVLGMLKP